MFTNVPPFTTLAVISPSTLSVAVTPGSVKVALWATVMEVAPFKVITGTVLSTTLRSMVFPLITAAKSSVGELSVTVSVPVVNAVEVSTPVNTSPIANVLPAPTFTSITLPANKVVDPVAIFA